MANADGTIFIDSKIGTEGLQSSLDKAGKLAAGAATAIATSLAAAGAAAIKVGADFYAAMSQVQAISGASAGDMAKLTQTAKEMGATTKFSASESAEALKYMGAAGWDAEQMIAGLPGVMNLAAASGESLGMVSDIVTDSLTAMGLQAEDAAHFADVLAVASNASNTNVAMMGDTFRYVAPLAGALGYTIEDLAVSVGIMANAGIKADQAGTALRSLFTRLVKPTKQSEEAMKKLGLAVTNVDGSMKPLAQVVDEMRAGFDGLTDAEKAQNAAMLAGQEGMSGLLALVNASDEDFAKLTEEINNAAGAAEEMARIMNDNLKGDMEQLGGAIETVAIQFFEAFDAPLREGVQAATEAVTQLSQEMQSPEMQAAFKAIGDALRDLIAGIAEFAADFIPKAIQGLASFIENFDKWAAVIKTATAAFIAFKAGLMIAGAVETVTKATQGAGSAMKALSAAMAINPWALAAAAVAALVVGLIELGKGLAKGSEEAQKQKKATDELLDSMRDLIDKSRDSAAAFEEQRQKTSALVDDLRNLAKETIELSQVQGRTETTEKRLIANAEELAAAIPALNGLYDEQNKLLAMTPKQIDAIISAEKARLELNDAQARKNELLNEQAKGEALVAQETQNRLNILAQLAEAEAKQANFKYDGAWGPISLMHDYAELQGTLDSYNQQLADSDAKLADLQIQQAGWNTELNATQETIDRTNQAMTDGNKVLADETERAAKQTESIREQYEALTGETRDLVTATEELIETLDDESEAYDASQASIKNQGTVMRSLVDDIVALSEKTTLSADEQAELYAKMDALNGLIPSMNLAFDEQQGVLSLTAAEMKSYVSAQEGLYTNEAAQERYLELSEQQLQVTQQLAEVEEQHTDVLIAQNAAQTLVNKLMGENGEKAGENATALGILNGLISGYDLELGSLAVQTENLKIKQGDLTTETTRAQNEMVAGEAAIIAAKEQGVLVAEEDLKRQEEIAKAKEKAITEANANIVKAEAQLIDDMTKAYERYASMTQNALDTINTKSGVTLKEAMKNLQDNQKTMDAWFTNLEVIAGKTDNLDFLAWLRGLGPEQSKLIGELATSAKFDEFVATWEAGGKEAMEGMKAEFEVGKPGVATAAKTIIDEVVLGMKDNPEITAAAGQMIADAYEAIGGTFTETDFKIHGQKIDADVATGVAADKKTDEANKTLITGAKTAADTQVTTSIFGDTGKKIDADIASGVPTDKKTETATTTMVQGVYSAAQSAVASLGFDYIGQMMDEGMANGLSANGGIVESAARAVALAAYEAAKSALEVKSPSKKFEYLGKMSVEGFAGEFDAGKQQSKQIVTDYMDAMIGAAESRAMSAVGGEPLLMRSAVTGGQQSAPAQVLIEGININTEQLNTEFDYRQAGRMMGEEIARDMRLKGVVR